MEGTCLAGVARSVCIKLIGRLCAVTKFGEWVDGWEGQTLTTPLYSCSKLCSGTRPDADEARGGGPSIQGHLRPPQLSDDGGGADFLMSR